MQNKLLTQLKTILNKKGEKAQQQSPLNQQSNLPQSTKPTKKIDYEKKSSHQISKIISIFTNITTKNILTYNLPKSNMT